MKELWMPILGWEDKYSVSSIGRIKRTNNHYHKIYDRILKTKKNKVGYISMVLYNGVIEKDMLVHRLVLAAFVGAPLDESYVVNHKDGNKSNNELNNLEYVTSDENRAHAVKLGLMSRGENHPKHKLTADQVRELREVRANGALLRELAAQYSIHTSVVSRICKRELWKHII